MQNRTLTERRGNRTQTVYVKPNSTTTVQVGITNRTEIFAVTGGTTVGNFRDPTPIKFDKQIRTYGNGNSFSGNDVSNIVNNGCVFGSSMAPDTFPYTTMGFNLTDFTSLRNRCISSIGEKIRGDVDLIIDLVELHKTRRMVDNAFNVVKFVSGLNQRLRNPKGWANTWLEYQYGWRPLVNSVYGTFKQYMTPPRPGAARFVAKAHEIFDRSKSTPDGFSYWRTQGNKRYEMKIFMNLSESAVSRLSGYTSLNPASIAWELMPYSFVVDWFVNVGGYLRNMETAYLNNALFLYGYETSGYRFWSLGNRAEHSSSGGSVTIYNGSMSILDTGKNRVKMAGYPYPTKPSMKVDLGGSQILSAAALLLQAVSGKK